MPLSTVSIRRTALAYACGAWISLIAQATAHGRHNVPVAPPETPAQTLPDFGMTATPPLPAPHSVMGLIAQHLITGDNIAARLLYCAAGAVLGSLLGAFFSDRFRRWRKLIAVIIIGIVSTLGVLAHSVLAFCIGFTISAVIVYRLLKDKLNFLDQAIFGDAHASTYEELQAAGLVPEFDAKTGELTAPKPGIPIGFTL